jgi:SRSO17 transposase
MGSQLWRRLAVDTDWQNDLERWLEPFLKGLGNKTRRRMCPAYIAGLIGPGDRKSIQPMAARADEVSYDRLHHFIGAGIWDSAPLEATLWQQADDLVGGEKAWLIIDDTALPKKGNASSGLRRNMPWHWARTPTARCSYR